MTIMLLLNIGKLNLKCVIENYVVYLFKWLELFYEGKNVDFPKLD